MKVGLLRFYPMCGGLFNIVIGPHPCGGFFAALCMYACMASMLIGFVVSLDAGTLKNVTWAIIVMDSLIYVMLCLSNPGIPQVLLTAAKNRNNGYGTTSDIEG